MLRWINYFIVFVLSIGLVACSASPSDVYRMTMNMEPPPNIRNLKEHVFNQSPAISSLAYFTYVADDHYFGILLSHNQFAVKSDLNQKFEEIQCASVGSLKRWTDKVINLSEKLCYKGTYVPMYHLIIYDPVTHQVNHFAYEFRE
jgi:hypothetical protein